MFVFIKKILCIGSLFLSSLVSATPLSCISIKNQECKVRHQIVDINSNNPIFYPFSVKINKCSGSCNNIDNSYPNICVPDVIKDLDGRVFNLMPRTNETRFIKCHETYKCICRLDEIICNSKQRWNENKCMCECKELIEKGTCDKDLFGILVISKINSPSLLKVYSIKKPKKKQDKKVCWQM